MRIGSAVGIRKGLRSTSNSVADDPGLLRRIGFQGEHLKGLILAQNERWRRGLGMQVEREPMTGSFGGNDWGTAANGVVRRR